MPRWLTLPCVLVMGMLISDTSARAQTPEPPADISGTWTLDTYLSDNPQQVAAAIRTDLGRQEFDLFSALSERGAGRAGGRRGEPPNKQPSADEAARNAEDQRALDAITAPLRYAPTSLKIAQTGTAITITDAQDRSRTFQLNGKREPQTFESTRADSTARWEGPQLVIDFDLGKGRKMTYVYSIVPTTRQLLVRVAFERAPRDPGPFEIKYVYNRTAPAGASGRLDIAVRDSLPRG